MSFINIDTEAAARIGEDRRRKRDQIKFFTIEEIAGCMDVCERTVRRWIENGLLVAHRIRGLVRISERDFRSFLIAPRDENTV